MPDTEIFRIKNKIAYYRSLGNEEKLHEWEQKLVDATASIIEKHKKSRTSTKVQIIGDTEFGTNDDTGNSRAKVELNKEEDI